MNKSSSSSGLGTSGVLTIVFVVLKLVGVIDWSWWWVLSPIWIDILAALLVVSIILLIEDVKFDNKFHDRRSKKIKW